METSTLRALEQWYLLHCNGEWEERCGVEIGTLGNPGWQIKIDLEGTDAEGWAFEPLRIERGESDWLTCRVDGKKFVACVRPFELGGSP